MIILIITIIKLIYTLDNLVILKKKWMDHG